MSDEAAVAQTSIAVTILRNRRMESPRYHYPGWSGGFQAWVRWGPNGQERLQGAARPQADGEMGRSLRSAEALLCPAGSRPRLAKVGWNSAQVGPPGEE